MLVAIQLNQSYLKDTGTNKHITLSTRERFLLSHIRPELQGVDIMTNIKKLMQKGGIIDFKHPTNQGALLLFILLVVAISVLVSLKLTY